MLIRAINYNLSLGYALIFLLAGLGLVALLRTFRNLITAKCSTAMSNPSLQAIWPISACDCSASGTRAAFQ
ncbi:MAG: hypothetical protein M5R42_01390 [Rhodocyclaceae bacterium]|nr:hypothetical protein [Rhodocyclaceae bacterium]